MKNRQGFTLIEVSIVLVIIGLIIGGILLGLEMVYQSRVRKMVGDVERYIAAVQTFRTKYNCLPGDCPNAYDYFGATCGANSTAGCNGNGDGLVNPLVSGIMQTPNELYKFWYHLYFAQLGPLVSGAAGSGPAVMVGVNIPGSAFDSAGYSIESSTTSGRNGIRLGRNNPSNDTQYIAHNPVFLPIEAFQIDSKYDDGVSSTGKMGGGNGFGGWGSYPCASAGVYNTSYTRATCSMGFSRAF